VVGDRRTRLEVLRVRRLHLLLREVGLFRIVVRAREVEVLTDQARADGPAVELHLAAVRLVWEDDLGDAGGEQRIGEPEEHRECSAAATEAVRSRLMWGSRAGSRGPGRPGRGGRRGRR